MRIAHFYAHMFDDGGCPSNLRSLAAAQLELGHEVVGFGFTNRSGNHSMPEGMRVVEAPRNPLGLQRLTRAILGMSPRPDVVQAWCALIPGNEYVVSRSHRAGMATALTLQGQLDPFLYRSGRQVQKRAYRRVAIVPMLRRWLTFVHAQSPYEARLARELGARSIGVFPLGTPSDLPMIGRPGPLRQALGLKDELLVGFFGRFDPVQKRFDAMLPALARCRDLVADQHVRFVLAGKGSDSERLRTIRMLQEHGLQDIVPMAGPFIGDDRFRALADLDVLLHPSRYEGLPRVIREAAAVGTPAIVTLQTNAESLVDAGGATLTGPDPGSIAAAVRSAIADAGWRSAASLAAQTWAKENDWVQCARHFQAAYERATT
jgi:glycosyltransferase involved in cell wall biosynthesis